MLSFSESNHLLYCLNQDQNLFTYELATKKQQLRLQKVASKCLFLDEVIDIKFIKQLDSSGQLVESDFAVLCSNSETLKVYNMQTGNVELYPGHSDIILCIDTYAKGDQSLVLTGAKDNQIRLWKFDPAAKF